MANKVETKRATPPLSERLKTLLKTLKAAYPMLTMEEDTARIYREGLMDLTGEFGFERTEKAVRSAITHCKFFPTLAEIRGLVPAESKTRVAYDDNCPHCHGTGWKRELQGVRRCMCRHLVEVQA